MIKEAPTLKLYKELFGIFFINVDRPSSVILQGCFGRDGKISMAGIIKTTKTRSSKIEKRETNPNI